MASYPALKTISTIYRVVAWLTFAVGLFTVFLALGGDATEMLPIGIIIAAFSLVIFAIAESIVVLVDIAHSTSTTVQLLRKIHEEVRKPEPEEV